MVDLFLFFLLFFLGFGFNRTPTEILAIVGNAPFGETPVGFRRSHIKRLSFRVSTCNTL